MGIRSVLSLPRLFLILLGIPLGALVYMTWSEPVTSRYDECSEWSERISAMMDVVDRAVDNDPAVTELMGEWESTLDELPANADPTPGGMADLFNAASAFHRATQQDSAGSTFFADRREQNLTDGARHLKASIEQFVETCRPAYDRSRK
jgi:hypothetical protein